MTSSLLTMPTKGDIQLEGPFKLRDHFIRQNTVLNGIRYRELNISIKRNTLNNTDLDVHISSRFFRSELTMLEVTCVRSELFEPYGDVSKGGYSFWS